MKSETPYRHSTKFGLLAVSACLVGVALGSALADENITPPKSGGPPATDLGLLNLQGQIKQAFDHLNTATSKNANAANDVQAAHLEGVNTGQQEQSDSHFIHETATALTRDVNNTTGIVQGSDQSSTAVLTIQMQQAALSANVAAEDLADAVIDSIINYYSKMTPEQALADYIDEGIEHGFIAPGENQKVAFSLISKAYAKNNTDNTCGVSAVPPTGNRNVDISKLSNDHGAAIPGGNSGLSPAASQAQCVLWKTKRHVVGAMLEHPKPDTGNDQNRNITYNVAEYHYLNGLADAADRMDGPIRQTIHHGTINGGQQLSENSGSFFIQPAHASTGSDQSQVSSNLGYLQTSLNDCKSAATTAHLLEHNPQLSAFDCAHAQPLSISANQIAANAPLGKAHTSNMLLHLSNTLGDIINRPY